MRRLFLAAAFALSLAAPAGAGWYFLSKQGPHVVEPPPGIPPEVPVDPPPPVEPGPSFAFVVVAGSLVVTSDTKVVTIGTGTTMSPGDTTAPLLSAVTDSATGVTTGAATITTDEAGGTLYTYLSTSCTPPSGTALRAGTGAVIARSQTVPLVGPQTILGFNGLTGGIFYCVHFQQADGNNNFSLIASGNGFTTQTPTDTTAPVLSAISDNAVGTNGGVSSVSTNENNGTLYRFLSATAACAPPASVAALKACTGAVGSNCGSQTVTASGVQTVASWGGLAPSTFYCSHFVHMDLAGNNSLIYHDANGFTTAADTGGGGTPDFIVSNRAGLDAALNSAVGGDIIELNTGNYGEYTNGNNFTGGYVTMRSAVPGGANFDGGLALTGNRTLNIIFDGVRLNGVGISASDGSHINNFKFLNCDIYTWGVNIGNGTNFEINNCNIHDVNTVDFVNINQDSHTFSIVNNDIYQAHPAPNAHPDGIQVFSVTPGFSPHDFTIRGNWIYDDNSDNPPDAPIQGIFISPVAGTIGTSVIEQNLVGSAITAMAVDPGSASAVVTVQNNSLLYNGNIDLGSGSNSTAGITVRNNVYNNLTDKGNAAQDATLISNYDYVDPSTIFVGPTDGRNWQAFQPKVGSPIYYGTPYGAQARLLELIDETTTPTCTLGTQITNGSTITFDGEVYTAQTVTGTGKTYPLRRWDCDGVTVGFRAEVHSGDRPSFDASDVERAEISGNTQYDANPAAEWWCSHSERVVTNHPNTLFVTSPQAHHDGSTGNPPWSMNYTQSGLWQLLHRFGATASGTLVQDYPVAPATTTGPTRNAWHNYVFHFKFNRGAAGSIVEVWQDGTQRVNLDSTTAGYGNDEYEYWKLGIYRGNSADSSIKDYTNIECQVGAIGAVTIDDRILAPLAVDIP